MHEAGRTFHQIKAYIYGNHNIPIWHKCLSVFNPFFQKSKTNKKFSVVNILLTKLFYWNSYLLLHSF